MHNDFCFYLLSFYFYTHVNYLYKRQMSYVEVKEKKKTILKMLFKR